MQTQDVDVRTKARTHASLCPKCGFTVLRYGRAINEAFGSGVLPDPVATEIRANLCKDGAILFDLVLGVGHA